MIVKNTLFCWLHIKTDQPLTSINSIIRKIPCFSCPFPPGVDPVLAPVRHKSLATRALRSVILRPDCTVVPPGRNRQVGGHRTPISLWFIGDISIVNQLIIGGGTTFFVDKTLDIVDKKPLKQVLFFPMVA